MIFLEVDKNNFIAKISNEKLANIDIFNIEEVKEFTKIIFSNLVKKYNMKGEVEFNIYIDINYGIIIDIKNNNYFTFDNNIDVKIIFHLNNIFLYEIDYFDILENTNIKKANIYYYKDKFYLELINDINKEEYNYLLESSNIIYNDKSIDIINKGIKLTI